MPTQQQVKSSVGGVAINLRRVRKENRKSIVRNFCSRLFDVVHPIVMGVIDTGQIDAVTTWKKLIPWPNMCAS
jgi:hypothetical protein